MTAAPHRLRLDAVLYGLLAVLFAIVLTYRVRDTIGQLDEVMHGDVLARLPLDIDFPQFTIGSLEPEAERVGLKEGDHLVGIEGRPVTGMNDFVTTFAHTSAKSTVTWYEITVSSWTLSPLGEMAAGVAAAAVKMGAAWAGMVTAPIAASTNSPKEIRRMALDIARNLGTGRGSVNV